MRLVKITDTLYVNPDRVIAVEERTIDKGQGPYTFTELTLETQTRWRLDIELTEVIKVLDPMFSPSEDEIPSAKWRGPHSRACGIKKHPHGLQCSTNCPTCGGRELE